MRREFIEDELGLNKDFDEHGNPFYFWDEDKIFFLSSFKDRSWMLVDYSAEISDGSVYSYQVITDEKVVRKLYL